MTLPHVPSGNPSWFWCVEHQHAVQQVGSSCTPVGPYATRAEAVDWGARINRFDDHTRLWADEITGQVSP